MKIKPCLRLCCLFLGLTVVMTNSQATSAQISVSTGTVSEINRMLRNEWRTQHITPSGAVDDPTFLRRVYVDITGVIPPSDVVKAFITDTTPGKRDRLVANLLNSPKYANNWTNYWDQTLMGRTYRAQTLDKVAWKQWLSKQFSNNVPYNRFVFDLISAEGINSTGGNQAKAVGLKNAPGQMMIDSDNKHALLIEDGARTPQGVVNGAVNWTLKYQNTPADLSGNASKIFLGVQIQCAQCHDHKTEKWKQDDFRKFTACFVNARPKPVGKYEKGMIRRVDLEDVKTPFVARNKKQASRNEYINQPPAAIDGTDFSNSDNRRKALAEWMTSPQNPWFAQAIVNRMWSHFLGRGFIEPIDDFRPSNPAIMPAVLKKLADEFVSHGYDLKYLITTIVQSDAYQRTCTKPSSVDPENKYFGRFRLKSMGPEQTLDSLIEATGVEPVLEKVAGGNVEMLKFGILRQLTFLFDVDEEFEQKDFDGTIPQALLLLNSNLTNRTTQPLPGTAMARLASTVETEEEGMNELYLRTLSRYPTPAEVQKWSAFVNAPREVVTSTGEPQQPALSRREQRKMFDAKKAAQNKTFKKGGGGPDLLGRIPGANSSYATPKMQAFEDMFWALLNSSEFAFNH